MTMLSFRVDEETAASVQGWSDRLGSDRSEILREALRLHLVRLAGEDDVRAWELAPLGDEEKSLASIADWGPAEDWADWSDAAR